MPPERAANTLASDVVDVGGSGDVAEQLGLSSGSLSQAGNEHIGAGDAIGPDQLSGTRIKPAAGGDAEDELAAVASPRFR